MSERLRRYMDEIDEKARLWKLSVGRPYVRAYDAAFASYNRTWSQQKEDDRTRAELFVLAASIATGSVMMAVLGSSLRKAVGKVILDTVCEHNLQRTFDTIAFVAENKTAMFAIGKVLDETRSRLGRQVQQAAVEAMTSSATIQSTSALNYSTHMEDFVETNASCAHKTASAIRDSGLGSDDQDRLVGQLEQASFFHPPPRGVINEQALADKMELSFFMADILNSDHLVTQVFQEPRSPMMAARVGSVPISTTRTPIDAMPQGDGNYPERYRTRKDFPQPGQSTAYSVSISGPGGKVRDRIDVLYKKVLNSNNESFFREQPFYDVTPATRHEELAKAQRVLRHIGEVMRPRHALSTAFH